MATLEYTYQDYSDLSTQLSIQSVEPLTVDYQPQPDQDLNTPTNEDLDRELEDLLNLMDTSEENVRVEEFLDPTTAVDVEWLDPTDLCSESAQFDYQGGKVGSSYSYQSTGSSQFDYEVDLSCDRTVTDHSSSSRGFDYNSTARSSSGNYSVDPSSNNFDYAPTTTSNDRSSYDYQPSNSFDYKPTPPTQPNNHYPTTEYSGGSSDHAVLDVEVDSNTKIRLEVGASVEISSGSARASAYAKATVYRRK
ncbi:MAG: hypothetical protein KA714_30510 [Limnoraphis sp. WC205]|nr:hypothetical protein [Limnoraphis sp. WC205]